MPMFKDGLDWPLTEMIAPNNLYRENAAWASGDSTQIETFGNYKKYIPGKQGLKTLIKSAWNGTNGRWETNSLSCMTPENLGALIVSKSANLLFSEKLKVTTPDSATQKLLDEIVGPQFDEMIREAAESAAIYGGVFLRASWDSEEAQYAFVTFINPDLVIPEFGQFGLKSAKIVTEFPDSNNVGIVRRLVELIEVSPLGFGRLVYGWYEGEADNLGTAVDMDLAVLDGHEDIADIGKDDFGNFKTLEPGSVFRVIETGVKGLPLVYVKNLPADVTARGLLAKLGRSDMHAIKHRLARVDRLAAQWAEEIELGKSRLIIPANMLEEAEEGEAPTFDVDRSLFTPSPALDPMIDKDVPRVFTHIQPNIRTADMETALDYFKRSAIVSAGYSPSSFGIKDGVVALTATEVKLAKEADYKTAGEKALRFTHPLVTILKQCIAITGVKFGGSVKVPEDIFIEFGDAIQPDETAIANENGVLRSSGSASTETLVRRLPENAGKTDKWILEEVAKIDAALNPTAKPTTPDEQVAPGKTIEPVQVAAQEGTKS